MATSTPPSPTRAARPASPALSTSSSSTRRSSTVPFSPPHPPLVSGGPAPSDFLRAPKLELADRARDTLLSLVAVPRATAKASGCADEIARSAKAFAALDPAMERTQAALDKVDAGLVELRVRAEEAKRALAVSVVDVREVLSL
ncbi:hypothetical protein HK104_004323 [Borealophlyctis nickersoniae]|nr:hypothetical protein HK104_004323 [Borealophlyctis nickersoniae]